MDAYPDFVLAEGAERGWGIFIHCHACNKKVKWGPDRLRLKGKLSDLAARLRCDDCGSTDGHISTVQVTGGNGGVPPTHRL